MQLARRTENLTACMIRFSKYPGTFELPDTQGLVQACTGLAIAHALKLSQEDVESPSTCWFVSKLILLLQKRDQDLGKFETLLLLCRTSMFIFFKFVSD